MGHARSVGPRWPRSSTASSKRRSSWGSNPAATSKRLPPPRSSAASCSRASSSTLTRRLPDRGDRHLSVRPRARDRRSSPARASATPNSRERHDGPGRVLTPYPRASAGNLVPGRWVSDRSPPAPPVPTEQAAPDTRRPRARGERGEPASDRSGRCAGVAGQGPRGARRVGVVRHRWAKRRGVGRMARLRRRGQLDSPGEVWSIDHVEKLLQPQSSRRWLRIRVKTGLCELGANEFAEQAPLIAVECAGLCLGEQRSDPVGCTPVENFAKERNVLCLELPCCHGTTLTPAELVAQVVITLPSALTTTTASLPVSTNLPPLWPAMLVGFLNASMMARVENPTPSREMSWLRPCRVCPVIAWGRRAPATSSVASCARRSAPRAVLAEGLGPMAPRPKNGSPKAVMGRRGWAARA